MFYYSETIKRIGCQGGIATIKVNEAVALVKVWKQYSNEGNLVL